MNPVRPAAADIALVSPLTGPVVALAAVPDPVFAEGLFGDGVGIDPRAGQLVAPCDGVIMHVARTRHCLTLQTDEGAQVLLHLGIDTAALDGNGFTAKVAQGEQVCRGDLLIEFDCDGIARVAPSLISVVAVANSEAFEVVWRTEAPVVEAGVSPLLVLRLRDDAAPHATALSPVETEARRSLTWPHPGGLHARPAARAREAARGYQARVEVRHGERKAGIESVTALLALGASQGATIEFVAIGPDAQDAVDAVVQALMRAVPEAGDEAPARRVADAPAQRASEPDPRAAHTLAGLSAAPGLAVGTLVHWGEPDLAVPEAASGSLDTESRALETALAAVDAALDDAVHDAKQRGASDEAAIFEMHRVLLEDPLLADAARSHIGQARSAGFAWREAVRAQINVVGKLDDARLAARVADLRDLEKRVLGALGHAKATPRALPDEAVLAADEFTPSDLAALDRTRVKALVMARGGATSHAAIIARQAGIAALVALGDALHAVPEGALVIVDADAGRLFCAPDADEVARARSAQARARRVREADRRASRQPAATRDGRTIEVAANIATLEDAQTAIENGADAVGLLRTELMFTHREAAPTVEEHHKGYQAIVDALAGRTAIIRTLDVGGDKEVAYLKLPAEPNPALGLRGIRLAQVYPDLLDGQLRGLLAVRPSRAVRIMLPMVTDVAEFMRLRERIDTLAREAGHPAPMEVGAMVEVPSAALLAAQLARHADFLSIGTNDLAQYTLAMDRCQPALAEQADGLHPAVLKLVAATVEGAAAHGRPVAVCGALAGDPVAVPLLIGLGVTELSVAAVSVPAIKARVRGLDWHACRKHAREALALDSAQAVRAASRRLWPLDQAAI